METSIFPDKFKQPDDAMLYAALGDMTVVWQNIRDFVFQVYPNALEEWNFPGQKYGWSFRIKDKKRAIIYFLPRDGYFLVAFVYGEKATKDAIGSNISFDIKSIIESARVYVEGRGFSIEVKNDKNLDDIKKLVDFKLRY